MRLRLSSVLKRKACEHKPITLDTHTLSVGPHAIVSVLCFETERLFTGECVISVWTHSYSIHSGEN